MGLLSDLFSSSDPEGAIEKCYDGLTPVWKSVEDQLPEQERDTIFPRFVRHPFVLGTVWGFIQPVADQKGVSTDDLNGVLAALLRLLVGEEVGWELAQKMNRLSLDSSEEDPQFKKGFDRGISAGQMYVEGLQTPGKVLAVEGMVDKGPQEPMYAETLLESYEKVLEDDLF